MQKATGTIRLAALAATLTSALLVSGSGCVGPSDNIGSINTGPTANPNSDMSVEAVSGGSGSLFLPTVNGYSGAITTTVSAGSGATATIEDQTNVPAPPPAVNGALLYISISVSNSVTFTASGLPSLGFMINVPHTLSGQYYLAFYDPTVASPSWNLTWIGPASSGNSTLNLNTNAPITLQANQTYWYCLY